MMTLDSTEDIIVVYLCTHITAKNPSLFPISYNLNLLELLVAIGDRHLFYPIILILRFKMICALPDFEQ